jgi:hypothetical protein
MTYREKENRRSTIVVSPPEKLWAADCQQQSAISFDIPSHTALDVKIIVRREESRINQKVDQFLNVKNNA